MESSSSSTSFSGSSKRAKAPSTSSQVPQCLVDGCAVDLSLCRDYHRRHKVCEAHSKSPVVTIEGREQRFCQQCSRFHSLVEFDEGKRSCRKRLEGHNRRRRKPQAESLIQNHPGFLFSNQSSYAGTRILSFGDQQVLPSSVIPSKTWSGLMNSENAMGPFHQTAGYNERPEAFLKFPSYSFNDESSSMNTTVGHPSLSFLSEGLNHKVVDCDRALSLLSPAPEATQQFSLKNHTGNEPLLNTQPSIYNYHDFSSLNQFPQESRAVASSSQYHDSNVSTTHVPEMFQHGEDPSSAGSHQTLSFMWE